MINSIKTAGKFLDQPILISKLDKAMPKIMGSGVGLILLKEARDTFSKNNDSKEKHEENKKKFIKKAIVMTSAVASALLAPKIASKITKRPGLPKVDEIIEKNKKLIDNFIKNNELDEKTIDLLNKAKEKPLSIKNVKILIEKLGKTENGGKFLEKLIPDPENVKAKDIISEIGFLSVYGAIPVVGGILGGIGADIATKENFKEKMPDKINEGLYQYLANIFMCNIGAAGALGILEKMGITQKPARAAGMTAGIIATGVLGGSKIANFISKKIISPIIQPNKKIKERKPEALDLCLHTDDIATVSLLSGLKWIEPSLPILYSVSGYKSGIGYRN